MYAIIETGGKQYKVAENTLVHVEKLDADPGQTVTFDLVLLVAGGEGLAVGAPIVVGAQVQAEVVEQSKGPKVVIFKKRRRHNYRRKAGHRQKLTLVRITGISVAAAA